MVYLPGLKPLHTLSNADAGLKANSSTGESNIEGRCDQVTYKISQRLKPE